MPGQTYFAIESAFPPSFADHPWIYMGSVCGLLLLELLALNWLFRLCCSLAVRGRGWRDPITVNRMTGALLVLCPILGGLPDLILLMMWPEWTPAQRGWMAMVDRQLDGWTWVPFVAAWMLSRIAGPMVDYQLERNAIPVNLWPPSTSWREPILILCGVALMSFSITFLRPGSAAPF